MPNFDIIQTSFLGGEISPRAYGRLDLEIYKSGCTSIVNSIVRSHGGVCGRGGTKYVAATKYSDKVTRLQGHNIQDSGNFMLEFGDYYLRFYKDQAQIQVAYSAWVTGTSYVLGNLVTESGSYYRCIVAHTAAAAFATDLASGYWEATAGATDLAYEIPTDYLETNVKHICFASDSDTLYMAINSDAPKRLDYTADDDWAISDLNYISFDLVPSAGGVDYVVGEVLTVTQAGASGGTLRVMEVDESGAVLRVKVTAQGTGYDIETGLATVASLAGDNNCTVDCISDSHPSTWTASDYPGLVWFFEQRLMFAATVSEPNAIWGSHSADYFNFNVGTGLDSEGLYITVKQANKFVWAVATDTIMLGATNGEFLIVASAVDDALTPSNIRPIRATGYGSAEYLPASQIDSNAVFVQRGKRKVRRLQYDLASNKYVARDISLLSEHITSSGIVDIAYINEPDSIIWFIRDDGVLVGHTYDPDNNVYAWHRHGIAGTDIEVSSIAGTDGMSDAADELWMVVSRTIDGSTVQYIEFLMQGLTLDDDIEDSFFVDSGVTATGSSLTAITGLDHLEGEEVQILADGAVQAPATVTSGEVALSPAADVAHAGLGFSSYVDLLPLEGGNPLGTSQGKMKTIFSVAFRLNRTLGLEYGVPDGTMDRYYFGPGIMDEGATLFTGDTESRSFPGGPDTQSLIRIQQTDPLPFEVLAVMISGKTEI